ncbi:MAG TPA: hypothetical protein VNJ53_04520 [Gaiellaceae bacterium]|nr:hypothetical protein [Gaiellaceae bacterium]
MGGVTVENVRAPDEVRAFARHGHADVVNVGGHPVIDGTFEPGGGGPSLKPIAQTDSCQATHLLSCISGRMHVQMNDGTEAELGPGDVAARAGHDAWVVGDEPGIAVGFGGYAQDAKG